MTERWIQAVVVGPGKPGYVRIALGSGIAKRVTDVRAELIPSHLRIPNSMFLAIMSGNALVRVEEFDQRLIDIQDGIRTVLNAQWDPIGAAHTVDDEYDSYIRDIVALLEGGASAEQLAEYLRSIEVDRMTLTESPHHKLVAVAEALRAVPLDPDLNRSSEICCTPSRRRKMTSVLPSPFSCSSLRDNRSVTVKVADLAATRRLDR